MRQYFLTLLLSCGLGAKFFLGQFPFLVQGLSNSDELGSMEMVDGIGVSSSKTLALGLTEKMLLQDQGNLDFLQRIIDTRNKMRFYKNESIISSCVSGGSVRVSEAPFQYSEGEGVIHVRQYGPLELGSLTTKSIRCRFYDLHPLPNTLLKGYWYRIRDADTGRPLGYPPVMNHHTHTLQFDQPSISRRSAADFQCKGTGTLSDEFFGGTYCNLMYFPEGVAYPVSDNARGSDPKSVFYVVDSRLDGAPQMRIYLESYTFYITKPNRKLRSWRFFTFGPNPVEDRDRLFVLPANQSSINMRPFYFRGKGAMADSSFHLHSAGGDEGWLVRGNVMELLGLAPTVYPGFHAASESPCDRLDGGEYRAVPLSEFFQIAAGAVTAGISGHRGGSGSGSSSRQSMAPPPPQTSFEDMKLYLASLLGTHLMCRYIGQHNEYTPQSIAKMERYYHVPKVVDTSTQPGGSTSGAATSFSPPPRNSWTAAMAGWKPGKYFRHVSKVGPQCNWMEFGANEVFTVVSLSGPRVGEGAQHGSLNAHVSFDRAGKEYGCEI